MRTHHTRSVLEFGGVGPGSTQIVTASWFDFVRVETLVNFWYEVGGADPTVGN